MELAMSKGVGSTFKEIILALCAVVEWIYKQHMGESNVSHHSVRARLRVNMPWAPYHKYFMNLGYSADMMGKVIQKFPYSKRAILLAVMDDKTAGRGLEFKNLHLDMFEGFPKSALDHLPLCETILPLRSFWETFSRRKVAFSSPPVHSFIFIFPLHLLFCTIKTSQSSLSTKFGHDPSLQITSSNTVTVLSPLNPRS